LHSNIHLLPFFGKPFGGDLQKFGVNGLFISVLKLRHPPPPNVCALSSLWNNKYNHYANSSNIQPASQSANRADESFTHQISKIGVCVHFSAAAICFCDEQRRALLTFCASQ